MKQKFISAAYLVAGIVNFLPVMGLLGRARLEAGYQIKVATPDLLILMQHRAVLFGLVGGALLLSVFKKDWRPLTGPMGLISMAAFILLVFMSPAVNAALLRLAFIDIMALLLLVIGITMERRK